MIPMLLYRARPCACASPGYRLERPKKHKLEIGRYYKLTPYTICSRLQIMVVAKKIPLSAGQPGLASSNIS